MKRQEFVTFLLIIVGSGLATYYAISGIACASQGGQPVCYGEFHTGTAIFVASLALVALGIVKWNLDNR